MIAGVIGGLSTHFGLDPKLARIAWILVTLFGGGLVAYLAAWFVLPDDTEQRSMVPIALLLLVVVIPIGCGICAWLIQLAALASSPAFDSNF